MPGLTSDEIDGIAERMSQKLINENRAAWVDPETHSEHHRWAARKIQAEEEAVRFRRKVIGSLTIWAALLVVGFVAAASWRSITDAIRHGMGD